ncbi:MAG: TIR domain-containing protein [Candidatus Omnitrophica bacterium]|nr:TIR domain-containing protein [Candidatus Omnitrophota bacterium]
MEENAKLKIFIAYSHEDNLTKNPYIEQFRKHIAPLKNNDSIIEWYDRKIIPGDDYQSKIDNNLEDVDIICLFVSANFLNSSNCLKEKAKAMELRKKKGIAVVSIILSSCGWPDDVDISKLLVLPTDGNPVSNFKNHDEGWQNVYEGLKTVIEKEAKIRQLKVTGEFESFLQNAEMLTKAHSQKEIVSLDDIFVYPPLGKFNALREYEAEMNSEELIRNLLDYPRILIAGDGQSGKTALCKMIFKELRKHNFVPVYVYDSENQFKGKIENKITYLFHQQYEGINLDQIDKERIVPIVDDFYLAKDKEKNIKALSVYSHCIVIVDDIFGLNVRDEKLIGAFNHFKIKEFKPSLRCELIKKWTSLANREIKSVDSYKSIDEKVELTDSILGKNIDKGILPAYPFFILSAIVTYDTFAIPLDQEITSQGYCYQALIFFYLRKQGVKNDEIDIYINFLTEFAFYIYKEKKIELSVDDFAKFMEFYQKKFNFPIKTATLLKNLIQIVSRGSLNNYSFTHSYLYYFFAAKHIAEHFEENKKEIEKIMNNLHVNENAYIAVFMVHHSKNENILNDINLNALCLFDKYKEATLTKEEVKFFDEEVESIIKAALPPDNVTPEMERNGRLKIQDHHEQSKKEQNQRDEDLEDSLGKELRRAIRTVEVMGCIIKNRSGSLEKPKLEEIFEAGMKLHLRILSSFFAIIKDKEGQKTIITFISDRLKKIIKENETKNKKLSEEELEKIAKKIFWNSNIFVVCGIIYKIVHSLGSDKLTEIAVNVCEKENNPAFFLVLHGILMWYKKNLQIEKIVEKLHEEDFSETAKRVMKFMIVDHCSLHHIDYKDKQRIENKIGIPAVKICQ